VVTPLDSRVPKYRQDKNSQSLRRDVYVQTQMDGSHARRPSPPAGDGQSCGFQIIASSPGTQLQQYQVFKGKAASYKLLTNCLANSEPQE
jgi:hypothetical protein